MDPNEITSLNIFTCLFMILLLLLLLIVNLDLLEKLKTGLSPDLLSLGLDNPGC